MLGIKVAIFWITGVCSPAELQPFSLHSYERMKLPDTQSKHCSSLVRVSVRDIVGSQGDIFRGQETLAWPSAVDFEEAGVRNKG